MPKSIRIVIADDSEQARTQVRGLLDGQKGLKIIAEAGNGHDVIALVREHVPDIVLMDFEMPVLNGFQALKRIRQDKLPTKVIVVSGRTDRALVEEAQELGAQGYVSKLDIEDDLIQAIEAAIQGKCYVSRSLKRERNKLQSPLHEGGNMEVQKQNAGVCGLGFEKPVRVQQKVKQNGSAQNGEEKIVILILDDAPMVWQLVAPVLDEKNQFRVVKNSPELIKNRNEESALQLVAQEKPDIVLLDLLWQDRKRGGWWILGKLQERYTDIKVIVFSDSNGLAYVNEAVEKGARGYVAKSDWVEDLSEAILEVHNGKSYYSRSVPRPENPKVAWLTDTQIKVFRLYVNGHTRDEIATELFTDQYGYVNKDNCDRHKFDMKYHIGHPEGWKGVKNENKELLDALDMLERQVFNCYVGGVTRIDEMAKELGVPENDVKDCMRTVQRKLVPIKKQNKHNPRPIFGCHPEGWKGIARYLRLID